MNISELNGSLTKRFENIQNPSMHSLPQRYVEFIWTERTHFKAKRA
jgi:hypothetical protein